MESQVERREVPAAEQKKATESRPSSAKRNLLILMWLYYPFLGMLCLLAGGLAYFFIQTGLQLFAILAIPFYLAGGFFALTVLHVLAACRGVFAKGSFDDEMEFLVDRRAIAGLYNLMRKVAKKWNLPAADEIRLHAESIAHVYEDERQRRILVVGGVALAAFTQKALAGVIAHELGHFAAGDTRFTRVLQKWLGVIRSLEWQVHGSFLAAWNPLIWCVRGYHWLFMLAWAANSRQQEFAADEYEVSHVGKEEAARTTILLSSIEKLPWVRLSSIAELTAALNLSDQQLFSRQVERARNTSAEDWRAACRKALDDTTDLFDTHPCLKERLMAMGIKKKKALQLAGSLNQSGPPARNIINNWEEIESVLSSEILSIYHEIQQARTEMAQILGAIYG